MLDAVNGGQPNKVHGMIEMRSWPRPKASNVRLLAADRCFAVDQILRAAHVVPLTDPDRFVVNNFVDFSEYNALYSETWADEHRAHMEEYNLKRMRTAMG
jgi:hypothetical protein